MPPEITIVLVGGPAPAVPGSVQALCDCGAKIWLAPPSMQVVEQHGHEHARLICMDCFRMEVEMQGGPVEINVPV
jgi:hypothetical protein